MLENVEAIQAPKPAKLFVATPMYGGYLRPAIFRCITRT